MPDKMDHRDCRSWTWKGVLGAVLLAALGLVGTGCNDGRQKRGTEIRIDYRNAEIEKGDWIQIDTARFEHIGDREEAGAVRYPLPSNRVRAIRGKRDTLYRDYNPRAIPIYLAEHLEVVNKGRPEGKRYRTPNAALMQYSGVLTLTREDSAAITVETSPGYGATVLTTDEQGE
jgi:hypothetical protein